MKLSLNKTGISRYQKRSGNILVTVEKQPFTEIWTGCIENMTHFAKDFNGNDVEMGEELFTWKSSTKKEVYSALTSYLLNN